MNGFTNPGTAWTQGLGLWCKLWKAQIDTSLNVWAAWAALLPRPDARSLSAEAERRADPAVARASAVRRPATPARAPAAMALVAEPAQAPTLH